MHISSKAPKIRFGVAPFSSSFANLLSFLLAFAQLAHGILQSWTTPSRVGPHSTRSSMPVLYQAWVCISFPEGKQGRECPFPAFLTSLIWSTLIWPEGLGTTLLGAVFFPQPSTGARRTHQHTTLHKVWLFPGVHVTCSSHPSCRRFWTSHTCCTILVSRSVSSTIKPACYLLGSAWDWELPEQGSEKDTTSWQNTEIYYSPNRIKCTVSTEEEKRKTNLQLLNLFSWQPTCYLY